MIDERRAIFEALQPRGTGPDRPVLARALELLEAEPLATAGYFPGDLARRLMELPPCTWHGSPDLYSRYQAVVRAAAIARRGAPEPVRRAFWRDLPGAQPR
jgi:hypothetical protein